MGLFSKLFGSKSQSDPPTQDQFAQMVTDSIRRAGEQGIMSCWKRQSPGPTCAASSFGHAARNENQSESLGIRIGNPSDGS
jgi:hypothetical protein